MYIEQKQNFVHGIIQNFNRKYERVAVLDVGGHVSL